MSIERDRHFSRLRVGVIFGGRSNEHSISCLTAASVMRALDPQRFEIVPIGITPEGGWVLANADPAQLSIHGDELPQVAKGEDIILSTDPTADGTFMVAPDQIVRVLGHVDVVFPLLHGPFGEDGTLQGLLEMAGIPYVGSGVLSSAVCMDKEYTKKLLRAEGLPVGEYAVLRPGQQLSVADQGRLGFPMFVKPARGGSSLGVVRVSTPDQLPAALDEARSVDPKVIVEAAAGRDVECAVLQRAPDTRPEASVLAAIRPSLGHEWYDFEAKYLGGGSDVDIPAPLPDTISDEIRDMACRAFTALDCAGLARVDFFIDDELTITLNEINTMPGFTPTSAYPRMWEATGLPYSALVECLIHSALPAESPDTQI